MNLRPLFGFKPAMAMLALALSLAACAKDPNADLAGGPGGAGAGIAAPGSVQEFNTAIGDRVFFDSDSSELSATATATLDKQASWLARYASYNFTVEGHADERGTRANIISRSASVAPRRSRPISSPKACRRSA